MESQVMPGDSNMHSASKTYGGNGVKPPNRALDGMDFLLRLVAIGATLAAAILMGTDKQTVVDTLIGPIPAKYHHLPAFVFFVVANSIACVYAVLSINNSIANIITSRSPTFSRFLKAFLDLVVVALLSSGASAAAAIGYVAWKGNSHTQWGEICNIYDRFCAHAGGAIASSFVAVICFMLLSTLSTYAFYKYTT